nr:PREDICTED: ankyrin repeat and zinc finger domain-containing protein 1-like isoform X2 [Bemisia tabaci]
MDVKQVVPIGTKTFESLLDGLALLNLDSSQPEEVSSAAGTLKTHSPPSEETTKSNQTGCSVCKCSFTDHDKFRQHFKEDWHRYNLKLSLKERDPISEKEFEEFEDDVSSISGSESESSSDDDSNAKYEKLSKDARVLFKNSNNQVLSLYRCLFSSRKEDVSENESVLRAKALVQNPTCLIMMLGGGHFAAALFKDGEPILHKTFHSYTVRQKQGSSQSSNDNKGSFAKSAGASLRRYNETILAQHIQEITAAWAKEIDSCDFIFYRAVGPGNKKAFFGGKNPPLDKADPRLRTIPFNTKRATFNEVKRVYNCLKSVLVYDLDEVLSVVSKPPNISESMEQKQQKQEENCVPNVDEVKETPIAIEKESSSLMFFGNNCVLAETAPLSENIPVRRNFFDEINSSSSEEEQPEEDNAAENEAPDDSGHEAPNVVLVGRKKKKRKRGKQKMLDESTPPGVYLNRIFLSALEQEDHVILEQAIAENAVNKYLRKGLNSYIDAEKNTLLHFASKKGYFHHVWVLLEAGASPCYKNKAARTAYDVSLNKDTRDTFRRFYAEFPEKFDYTNSHIPKPLTEELVKAQNEKKREKNRKMKQKIKEKREKEKEEEDRLRFLQLSDREKRALAAERRILAQQEESKTTAALPIIITRCFLCGCDMTGKIPFELSRY